MLSQLTRHSGWLNLIKPKGISSGTLVGNVKNLLSRSFGKGSHKVGHAGTLDPLASGVLPIAIGKATRLIEYLTPAYKCYEFTVRFGQRTDTGDLEGKIVEKSDNIPTLDEIKSKISDFIGQISQIPPVYSAIKINGERSYKLARQNKSVVLASRIIEIRSLRLTSYQIDKKEASYITQCSSGTYIRSLAEDIAKSLGTCGVVSNLIRRACGEFEIDNAFDIFTVDCENRLNQMLKRLLPLDFILSNMDKIILSSEQSLRVQHGLHLEGMVCKAGLFTAYHEQSLIAIGEVTSHGVFKAKKVLAQ
jgi:tRNA pseudouridine55 synthase